MKIVDIATEIHIENGEPSDTSIAAISYWLRRKVGELNSLIYSAFSLNTAQEIVDGDGNEISIDASAILKKMWEVDRYDTLIRQNITAINSGGADVLEIEDDNAKVRMVNKNEVIKSLRGLKDSERMDLNRLVDSYRIHGFVPTAVHGDDTELGVLP